MKKLVLFSAIGLLFNVSLLAQPIVGQADMPQPGDTIQIRTINNVHNINDTVTGANHYWNFSSFVSTHVSGDTFVSVSSTPLVYKIDFSDPILYPNYVATVAQRQPNISLMSYVNMTNIYYFFKASATSYSQVGEGITINNIPYPIQYHDPDLLYNFPITMGDVDSSYYSYHMSIPTLGYYGESRRRINVVDGWGKVVTPCDSFHAMRVFSTSYVHDTIHVDSLFGGIGFATNQIIKEYKWLADTMGLPVFKVTKTTGGGMGGGGTNAEYIYLPGHSIVDTTGNSIAEYPYSLTFVTLYPNPADESTCVEFALAKSTKIEIDVSDVTGKLLKSFSDKDYTSGFHSVSLGSIIPGLSTGIYFVRIKSPENSRVLKLQVM